MLRLEFLKGRRTRLGLWTSARRRHRYLFLPRGKRTFAWLRVGGSSVRVQVSG